MFGTTRQLVEYSCCTCRWMKGLQLWTAGRPPNLKHRRDKHINRDAATAAAQADCAVLDNTAASASSELSDAN